MMLCFNGKRDFFPLFFLINTSYLPMYLKSVAYNRAEFLIKKIVILGVHINETCYKTRRVSTRDFTVGIELFQTWTRGALHKRPV